MRMKLIKNSEQIKHQIRTEQNRTEQNRTDTELMAKGDE